MVVRRLILPKLDYSGVICVEFYYHMFGFHVRSLRLVQRTATSAGEVIRTVWMRSGQKDTTWYHASSEVIISPDSRVKKLMPILSKPFVTNRPL